MRPRGMPPTPMAASRLTAPVGMKSTRTHDSCPIRMIEPLPRFFSICAMARLTAFFFSSETWGASGGDVFSAGMVTSVGYAYPSHVSFPLLTSYPGTEYIPKPASPPLRSERIFQVLDPGATGRCRNPNHIKAIHITRPAKPVHPGAGHAVDLPPLAPTHGLQRAPKGLSAAGLDLDERHPDTFPGQQGYFQTPHAKPVVQDPPAAGHKEPDGRPLARQAAAVAGVGPASWI